MAETLGRGARITGEERAAVRSQIVERYGAGEAIRSIADDLGRSYGWVQGLLKEAGVELRGRGGATRGEAAARRRQVVAPVTPQGPTPVEATLQKANKPKVEKVNRPKIKTSKAEKPTGPTVEELVTAEETTKVKKPKKAKAEKAGAAQKPARAKKDKKPKDKKDKDQKPKDKVAKTEKAGADEAPKPSTKDVAPKKKIKKSKKSKKK